MLTKKHLYTFTNEDNTSDCTLNVQLKNVKDVIDYSNEGNNLQFSIQEEYLTTLSVEKEEDQKDWVAKIKEAIIDIQEQKK